jgi:hypothetical protein
MIDEIDNMPPTVQSIYERMISERLLVDKLADRITASGTSEGSKKAWEKRHLLTPKEVLEKITFHDTQAHAFATKLPAFHAHMASREAFSLGEKASDQSGRSTHNQAAIAHMKASSLQAQLGNKEHAAEHRKHAQFHNEQDAAYWQDVYRKQDEEKKNKTNPTNLDWRRANRDRSYKAGSDD